MDCRASQWENGPNEIRLRGLGTVCQRTRGSEERYWASGQMSEKGLPLSVEASDKTPNGTGWNGRKGEGGFLSHLLLLLG